MRKASNRGIVASLVARGFDQSHAIPFKRGALVRCSQCDALVVNGIPCHETGCPNATHVCAGCSARIPARQRYCEDCNA